jgi:hypothetical protein
MNGNVDAYHHPMDMLDPDKPRHALQPRMHRHYPVQAMLTCRPRCQLPKSR